MQAYAEGYELLARSGLDIDAAGALAAWRQGSVVRSWLLDLLVRRARAATPASRASRRVAQDSGEGRWTVAGGRSSAASPRPVIAAALYARFVVARTRTRRHEGDRRAARAVRRPRRAARGRARRGARARRHGRSGGHVSDDAPPSDALVLFGATGDLAKKKIFPAVYEMARGGDAPTCRSIGFASSEWDDDRLRAARPRGHRGARATGRRGRVGRRSPSASPTCAATTATPESFAAPGRALPRPRRRAPALLPGHPAGAVRRRDRRASAPVGLNEGARVVVEKPFGRDLRVGPRAQRDRCTAPSPRSDVFRIDHFLGKESVENLLVFRFANSMLEPVWNRNFISQRADHDGRGVRRRGPRPLLRDGRRAARRRAEPPAPGRRPAGHGAAGRRRRRRAARREGASCSARSARSTRPTWCAASTAATATRTASTPAPTSRPSSPCASRSTRGAGPACRGSSAPASTCRSPPPRRSSSSTRRRACCSRRRARRRPHPNHLRFRLGKRRRRHAAPPDEGARRRARQPAGRPRGAPSTQVFGQRPGGLPAAARGRHGGRRPPLRPGRRPRRAVAHLRAGARATRPR